MPANEAARRSGGPTVNARRIPNRAIAPCCLSLAIVLAPWPLGAEEKPWPREFKAREVKVTAGDDPEHGHHAVQTGHFRIVSETEINGPDFDRFATVVESVPQLLAQFPLPLWAPADKELPRVIVCRDEVSFQKLGGQQGAVGWYDGRRRQVLLLSDYFLKPPALQPTRLLPRPNQDLLVHELVHLCMHGILWRIPPWFSEGVAEYFAVCHKGNGWFTFHDVETSLRDHLRKSISADENGRLPLLPVEKILGLDHKGWLEAAKDGFNGNPYLPYATALLLIHYHFNGGAARRLAVHEHLEALHALPPRSKTPTFPIEEKSDEIEAKLARFWQPKGLNLVFETTGPR